MVRILAFLLLHDQAAKLIADTGQPELAADLYQLTPGPTGYILTREQRGGHENEKTGQGKKRSFLLHGSINQDGGK